MKTIVPKYKYTAMYRGYEFIEDPTTGAKAKQYFPRNVKTQIECNIVLNALGQLVVHTAAKLQNDGYLGTLFRKAEGDTRLPGNETSGTQVMEGGTASGPVWRVVEGTPMFDNNGKTYAYKYRCQMIFPVLGSVTDDAPQEQIDAYGESLRS
jgi:hypothetical protein